MLEEQFTKTLKIYPLSAQPHADGVLVGSLLYHKTFLDFDSKTVLQHSPKQLKTRGF